MKFSMKALASAALIALIGGGAYNLSSSETSEAYEFVRENGQGTYVLNDEFSLWQNSFGSGNSYAAYEPVRVRENGTKYFFRQNAALAASGENFGEVLLTDDNGSLLYLPRRVKFDKADTLSVFVKISHPAKDWIITVYPSKGKAAKITKLSKGIQISQQGEWTSVSIPFSTLEIEDIPKQEIKEDTRNAAYLLSLYEPSAADLYGVEFSILNGAKGDQLFIDRLALQKEVKTPAQLVQGQVKPEERGIPFVSSAPRVEITAITDKGEVNAITGENGSFSLSLPEGAKMAEIYATGENRVYSPITGRFLEVGSYIPPLEFDSNDHLTANPPKDINVNDGLINYNEEYGSHYEPNHNFLVQVTTDDQVVSAAELKSNDYGFIDNARRSENPDNAYRVLVLGECHHMGVHINQSDLFLQEAEGLLNIIQDRPVEILSGSFNYALFTSSWPIFKTYGEIMEPDLVLIAMVDPGVLNASIEEYMMDWLNSAKDHRVNYQFEFDEESKLVHKPNDPDWQLYRSALSKEEKKRIRDQYLSSSYTYVNEEQTPQWVKDSIKLNTESLKEFTRLAKERGQRIGILYISDYGRSKTNSYDVEGVKFDQSVFLPLMRKMAEDAGMEFFDISESIHMQMDRKDFDYMTYKNNGHYTSYAHFRYGQALGHKINQIISEQGSK